ncbi:hypothetical protein HYN48_06540 [Flavobacterium magnum]|uniref:Secretion system C-terminal sorting domain-containing protein n=1 Tax=Flavobacterium magnum TaxID=2162713 RepID=A0A2S0RF92_9FLAO|nr:T9SS type A sorting domain-containing protein [Flavobacterium magnum]AWA29761.1 hypothetical protein HYN48_06540 [Flavobacterium magnum]
MAKKYLRGIALFAGSMAFAQNAPQVHLNLDAPASVCTPETCVTLSASLLNLKQTTGYDVAQIAAQSPYPFTGGTVIDALNDDVYSPAFPLGFNFCFYNDSYSTVYVGTNGVISFNPPVQGNFCEWNFNSPIPSTSFPIKNAIYGVYQDTDIRTTGNDAGTVVDPDVQNVNYYTGGEAPNRYLVVNFNELPQFQCGAADLQTSQVILYESSNIIDVYVKKRTACDSWNGGRGLIGLQNMDGTLAAFPPNRNTGPWETANEAWRFSPNGIEVDTPVYEWKKNGVLIADANQNTLTVCEDSPGIYEVSTVISACGSLPATISATATIASGMMPVGVPSDLFACSDNGFALFNLTSNTAQVLNGMDPLNYEVLFYHSYSDAMNYTGGFIPEAMLSAYMGFDHEVIFMRVTDLASGNDCPGIESFTLEIEPFTVTPQGDTAQDFEPGDTLAELEVEGENISWWDAPTEGNELPDTTPLVNGLTYYAQSENVNGCPNTENRMAAQRLAVTVTQVALGTAEFDNSTFTVAPNPVKDILRVNFSQNINSLEVYNLIGQRVLHAAPGTPHAQINLSGLPAGGYLMQINAGDNVKTVKLVKQ